MSSRASDSDSDFTGPAYSAKSFLSLSGTSDRHVPDLTTIRRSEVIQYRLTHSIVPSRGSPHVVRQVGLLVYTQSSLKQSSIQNRFANVHQTRRLVGHRFCLSILPLLDIYSESHDLGDATINTVGTVVWHRDPWMLWTHI